MPVGHALKVHATEALVLAISGTGTGPRDIPHAVVEGGCRAALQMGLLKTTYFYATSLHIVQVTLLQSRSRTCPKHLFVQLAELADQGAQQVLPSDVRRSWWPPQEPSGE
jgi:hypothetical protein